MKRAKTMTRQLRSRPAVTVETTVPDQASLGDHRVFTPTVFLARETQIKCVAAGGLVEVCVEEDDWEHKKLFLAINLKRNAAGDEIPGFVQPEVIDQVIEALVLARDKAKELGLLTFRQTPRRVKWIEDS